MRRCWWLWRQNANSQKTEITNQKWKKEIWKMTNLHTTTTNITVPRSLAHPLLMLYTKILATDFLELSSTNIKSICCRLTTPPTTYFAYYLWYFFVCCLFVSAPSMMFDSLLKAGLLMIFRQNKLLHFWTWKLVFFSLLSPTVLQSNRVHYYFLWISSHQELSFLLTLMRKEKVTI